MYNFIMLITPQTGPEPNTIHVGSETLKVLKKHEGCVPRALPYLDGEEAHADSAGDGVGRLEHRLALHGIQDEAALGGDARWSG